MTKALISITFATVCAIVIAVMIRFVMAVGPGLSSVNDVLAR